MSAHPESFCHECGGPNPVWSAPNELWNAVMGGEGGIVCPGCFTRRVALLVDSLRAAHARVVANEGNHYDRYWTPPPEPVTDEWLDETEAKMRGALTDVFCDDAAAIMLTLVREVRRGRELGSPRPGWPRGVRGAMLRVRYGVRPGPGQKELGCLGRVGRTCGCWVGYPNRWYKRTALVQWLARFDPVEFP